MTGRRFNVLISSAGRRVSLLRSFAAALSELALVGEVIATDAQHASSAMQIAGRSFLVPPCDDDGFVDASLDVCRTNHVDLVIPTIDNELAIWARHREEFAAIGTTVAVSAPEVVAIANDKVRSHAWLVAEGFPTTRQSTVEEVLAAPQEFAFPLVVKPRTGSGSGGFALVHDCEELQIATRKVTCAVVESFAHGDEYTIDVLVGHDGVTRSSNPRRRLEVRGGEVVKAVVERRPDLNVLATSLCDKLPGAYGVLNVQVIRDSDTAALYVIEINSRFGGGFPLTLAAGGRYPRWLIEEVLGLPSTLGDACWRDSLAMLRYDEAVYVEAGAIDMAPGR